MSWRHTSVVLMNLAAAVSAGFAVFAPALWTKSAVNEIRARELRLVDVAHALNDYAAEEGHFPLVGSCTEVQRVLVPRFIRSFSCEEAQGQIRYAAVSARRNCGTNEPACPPVAGAGYLLVSPGGDARIDRETEALLDSASTASDGFIEKEASIAVSATRRPWHSYVDGDIIRTESGFLSSAKILQPRITPPETIRIRFMTIGGAVTVTLLVAAAVQKRRLNAVHPQTTRPEDQHEEV
jgi:hypothetical protein